MAQGYTLEQLKQMGAKKKGYTLDELKAQNKPEKPNLANRIWADLGNRFSNVGEAVRKGVDTGEITPMEAGLQVVGQGAGFIGDVLFEGAKSITPQPIKDMAKKGIEKVVEIPQVKGTIQAYSSWAEKNPRASSDLEAVVDIASLIPGAKGGQIAEKGILKTAQKSAEVSKDLVKQLATQSEKSIEKSVIKNYEKGIKPLLLGKTSPNRLANYRDDIVTAVKTISENKPNLNLSDEIEGIISGQTPKSLQQLSEAVEQTKRTIFNQYDTLAKTAGEAGVTVDMKPIANELQTVINNKALNISSPKTVKYTQELYDRLSNVGKLDATTAQEVVQNYNKSLEAFYRNPSYDTASQAAVDAMIANKMRQALDEGITKLTGEQYGALKRQYGSLKSIEKDVIKASLRDARRNVKGLIDFSDIFSGGQIINGLLSLNPGLIAQGVTQKAIASFFKFINDPNRAVKKMFDVINRGQK